jgi:hypothetical protein
MSEKRHKTYKRERRNRHSIQQPPGKRQRANQLTHTTTHLLTHQWIPFSPSSPPTQSPRLHPSPPPPSTPMVAPAAWAALLLRGHSSSTSASYPSSPASVSVPFLLHPCLLSPQYHSSPAFMTSLFSALVRPSLSRAGVMNHLFDIRRPTASALYYWPCN